MFSSIIVSPINWDYIYFPYFSATFENVGQSLLKGFKRLWPKRDEIFLIFENFNNYVILIFQKN